MSPPRLSVLLPYRNAAATLGECLDSLEAQTFTDFELIAVDDGSTDASRKCLSGRLSGRLLHLDAQGKGLVAALNLGLAGCTAPLVARIDADDIAHAERFAAQVSALDGDAELGVVSCLVESFGNTAVGEGFRVYERWLNTAIDDATIKRERFIESPLAHPSVILRRELFGPGYQDGELPEDYELWLRLAESEIRFRKIPRVLHFWRDSESRLSRVDPRYSRAAFSRLKAGFLQRGPLRRARVIVWGAGQYGKRLARDLISEGSEIACFVDIDPRKIGRTMRDRPVFDAEQLETLIDSRTVVLAAVPTRGARELIRDRLSSIGLRETETFWCVA